MKTLTKAFITILLSSFSLSMSAYDNKTFGKNVYIFSPEDNMDTIHAIVDRIHTEMFREQFGKGRYAIFFKPGDYRKAGIMKVPYYMQMSGLGATPYDVILDNVWTPAPLNNDNGTCTFWRSVENFSVIGPESYNEDETFLWAVSQAAPIRRVYSERTVKNQWRHGWVSGGFTADCNFMAPAGSDGQQQWYTRNTHLEKGRGQFKEGSWNFFFQGVELGDGADKSTYVNNWDKGGNVTFVPATPIVREKPFLFVDSKGRFKVFRPALRKDAVGVSYTRTDMGDGEVFDVKKDFFVVKPGVTSKEINKQLRKGKHIIFEPGMYLLYEPLYIDRPNTIMMGLGYATLIPSEKNDMSAVIVEDVEGVTVCSLLFDAHYSSETLLWVKPSQRKEKSTNPILLADVFFRVGGFRSAPVNVNCALEIAANDVIGDHFWIWRADHGVPNSCGWTVNTSDYGLVVYGDDVTVYGLFNEHFQKYQTLWKGERGRVYFYQCETPYDALQQDRYMSENGTRPGYAAYKIGDNVNTHEAYGLGIYDVYFSTDIRMENSIEASKKPGIRIYHACNVSLSDPGPRGIGYLINGEVKSTYNTFRVFRSWIDEYRGGIINTSGHN